MSRSPPAHNRASDLLLSHGAAPVTLAPGQVLFRQGAPTFAIFRLDSGRVRLLRHGLDGGPLVLHTPRPGETFAEAALFSDHYHCDCLADVASTVTPFPRPELLRALETDPIFARDLARRLARQVQGLRARLELRNIRSAEQRVLALIDMRVGPDGSYRVEGDFKDLAAEIGLTPEALYRGLAALVKAGRLRRDGKVLIPARG